MAKTLLYAKNITELLTLLKNHQGSKVIGGCTSLEELPDKCVSTINIKELTQIERHERYIDVGAGVTLANLQAIGQAHLPSVLYDALNSISTPLLRNISTIGGNICSKNQKMTLFAPLMALGAKLEIQTLSETITENIANFTSCKDNQVLTNIRIPLVDSDVSIFRRIGPENTINEQSAAFAFMASIERSSLLKVKLTFAGPFEFHSPQLENSLIGRRLPLNQKDVNEILHLISEDFEYTAQGQMILDLVRQQFYNLCRYAFEQLT